MYEDIDKPGKRGRPPVYENAEDMQEAIDAYFAQCTPEYLKDDKGELITSKGKPIVINLNSPSLSGLALFMGYADRRSLYDNEEKKEYSYIIKTARTKVEEWVYQHTIEGAVPPAVGIFILKQFGYTDKQEVEYTNLSIGKPPTPESAQFPED